MQWRMHLISDCAVATSEDMALCISISGRASWLLTRGRIRGVQGRKNAIDVNKPENFAILKTGLPVGGRY